MPWALVLGLKLLLALTSSPFNNHECFVDISSLIGGFNGFLLDNAGALARIARFGR
ncbi:MAG: hypothetical protein FWG75_10390 [Cystobacterineae bacterium]|nr:hypothetical protein [Cystobacterineae bacterium]